MVVSTNEIVVGYKVVGQAELQRLASTLNNVSEADQKVLAEMRSMNTQMKVNASTATNTAKETTKSIKDVENETSKLSATLKGVGGLIAGAFAVGAITNAIGKIKEINIQYEQYQKAIDFATGSSAKGAEAFQFLTQTARQYGLDLKSLTEGYKNFAASSSLSGTSLKETNRQFLSVAKAAATLGLSSERTGLVLNALGQIASKGTVSMEELKTQIGDSLPGALGVAARSMGMTTSAFIKFTSEGKLASDVFLPRFATELEKTFGPNADKNVNTLTGSQNKFNTSIDRLILSVGTKLNPFLKGAYDLAAGIADQLSGIGGKAKAQTSEQIAAQRLENDLARKGFEIRQQTGLDVSRQVVARELLLGIDREIDALLSKQANLRVNSQKKDADALTKRIDVLKAEYDLAADLAGVVITRQKAEVKTTEQLQKEYDIAMKRLELEKQILILTKINDTKNDKQGEEDTPTDPALAAAQVEVVFQEKKLALQKKGVADGLKVTQQEVELTIQEKEKAATELIKVEAHQAIKTKDGVESLHKQVAAIEKRYAEESDLAKKQRLKDEFDRLEAERKETERIEKLKLHYRNEAIKQATNIALDITNGLFNIQQQNLANELTKTQQYYSELIRLAGDNVQSQTELREKQAQKEKEIKKKQFVAQQNQAIANAVFQAAPYIIEYTAGLPYTAANLALTVGSLAAQVAIIKSQPIPEFFKGVENFQGGFAKVGERGSELIETPKGTFLSPDSPTVTYLPKGTNVITAPKTRERLQMMNSTYRKGQDQFQVIDTSLIAAELARLPVGINQFDARGFTEYVRKGNRTTQILNKRKGL